MKNENLADIKNTEDMEYNFDFRAGWKDKIKRILRFLLRGDLIRWDPWIFKDGDTYRMFYLVGPKETEVFWSTGEIHGAISDDLKQWQELGVILEPEPNNSWESGRMLAGYTCKEDDIHYLFYSAAGEGDPELFHEQISLATSKDGLHWQRSSTQHDHLFLNLDDRDRWYGKFKNRFFFWRDPYVVKEPVTGKYYMFISAYLKAGSGIARGCIGLAVANKISGPYEVLPPIVAPTVKAGIDQTEIWPFYEMERPQVIYKNGQYNLFFSCWTSRINPKWLEKVGKKHVTNSSLYWYISEQLDGPFRPVSEKPIVKGSEKTGIYGTNFLPTSNPEEFIAYGWYPRKMALGVSPLVRARWSHASIEIK